MKYFFAIICIAIYSSSEAIAYVNTTISPQNCNIKIINDQVDSKNASCTNQKLPNGSKGVYYYYKDNKFLIYSSVQKSTLGKFYEVKDQKRTVKNFNQTFNYIRDNWVGIGDTPQNIKTADTKKHKVILYRLDLKYEKSCLTFSRPFGSSTQILPGSEGYNHVVSMVICNLENPNDFQSMIKIINSLSYDKIL